MFREWGARGGKGTDPFKTHRIGRSSYFQYVIELNVNVTKLFNLKVARYGFTTARALRTKALVICARSGENISVFQYMTTKSNTGKEFSRVSSGEIP